MAVPILVGTLAVASLIAWLDFKAWKKNGTGGTPPTLQGYWKIRKWGLWNSLHPQNLLDASGIPNEGPEYLDSGLVPERKGPRPNINRWALPQRQHRESITPKAAETLFCLMTHFATTPPYSAYLETRPSKTEGGTGPAIYVKPDVETINPYAHKIFYEVAHIHPTDNSLHVYLSPRDARRVVERNRGQRFSVTWIAPPSWVMVYAPRDESEVAIVREIIRAAVCFAVGTHLQD